MPDELERVKPVIFERRKFIRIDGTFVVSYTDISTHELRSDISQTKNISVGGLLLTTDKEFPAGAVLRIKLRLPEAPDYINLKVKVVDSKERAKGMLCDTRVKFLGLREEDKDVIQKIVEYYLRKEKDSHKGSEK